MKVVYVSMVVLVCKLQILIGSSHESPYACQCSTTECDDNEILKEIDNYSYSCVCLPQYYRNETTQKCELKYRWVNYTPELWNDTRLVHHNSLDKDFIVARLVKANGSKIPYEGYIFIFNKTIKPMPDVSRHSYKRFEAPNSVPRSILKQ
ncbi:hypothetical protein PV327_003062 [Microctonus hyperodae]|uniref:Uncharacterized protein n=1 Tax=Microctonus hyperodae TaxID=165561 RepID=A0AA39G381_MICHY|nr:hypothetical protein PV327_003062 [Microctonus hyperodae]